MSAKYQFYRNLHTDTFSLRLRSKVIGHPTSVMCGGCTFVVSKNGRKRVLTEKRKNVHAYVASDSYVECHNKPKLEDFVEVYYDPYKTDSFVIRDTDEKILTSEYVLLCDNKVYIPRINTVKYI